MQTKQSVGNGTLTTVCTPEGSQLSLSSQVQCFKAPQKRCMVSRPSLYFGGQKLMCRCVAVPQSTAISSRRGTAGPCTGAALPRQSWRWSMCAALTTESCAGPPNALPLSWLCRADSPAHSHETPANGNHASLVRCTSGLCRPSGLMVQCEGHLTIPRPLPT